MPPKAMKISDENYRWLSSLAGEFQKMLGRPISLDETLSKIRSNSISSLAGSWTVTDKEVTEIEKKIREGWKRWKTASA